MLRSRVLATLVLLAVSCSAVPASLAMEHFRTNDPASRTAVDHGTWEQFLLRYLRIDDAGIHRVAYGEVDRASLEMLDRYLDHLGTLALERYARREQIAYWLNLYNAAVVRLVLEHYPVGSILDIGGLKGPYAVPVVAVDNIALSLSDIRNRILLPIFGDPKIHYGLSCGAVGCPNLPAHPFLGARVEQQLAVAAHEYVNDRRCLLIDGGRLIASALYERHAGDFGADDMAVITHLMAFAKPSLAMRLQHFDHISDHIFDWRLNDARTPSPD